MIRRESDGTDSRLFNADNDTSSTRVGFKGKAKMGGGWSAGTTVEVQMESNSSSKVNLQGASTKDVTVAGVGARIKF